jgi:hypothetical protein
MYRGGLERHTKNKKGKQQSPQQHPEPQSQKGKNNKE